MDEYIPRKAVLDLQHKLYRSPLSTTIELSPTYIISPDAVQRIPAADVVPVRHGYWINLGKYSDGYNWRCSSCKRESVMAINYCPNCGAKMDGGQNE
jgi:rRNA maturation endonuclease Nob1